MALPASLQAVEEFFLELRQRSRQGMDQENCFAAELLVREALTNAVVHGCGADGRRQVRCVLRLKRGRLLVVVEDDGKGFNWHMARRHQASLPDCSGRGMEILDRYANRVRYSDRGNAVMIIKRFNSRKTP